MRLRRGVPVLSLGGGAVQIGINQPVILTGLTSREQHLLALLESPAGLTAKALGPDLVARLAPVKRGGMLDSPLAPPVTIAIRGSGEAAEVAASVLVSAGAHLASPDSGADAVVGFAVAAPDPTTIQPLMALDTPHLWVVSDEDGATVGPWVAPGEGACTRCVQLHRTETYPTWPLVTLQVPHRRVEMSSTVAHTAGAFAASMALAHVRDGARWGVNCQWRLTDGMPPQSQPVSPHSDCGCEAPSTSSRISAP